MKILFTRGHTLFSSLICSALKEPVSHCALDCGGWIVHCNLAGLQVQLPQDFSKHSTVLYSVEVPFDINNVMKTFAKYQHSWYDYGAFLYMGLRLMFPGLPRKNLWQTTGMFLCTEWVTEVLEDKESSMLTPYKLYLELKEKEV